MSDRDRLLWVTGALCVLSMLVLASLDRDLRTEPAPHGIVSFEFAGNASQAAAMIDSWQEKGRVVAGLVLGFDYLFLFAYGFFLLLACGALADRHASCRPTFARWLRRIGRSAPVAALLDAVENFGSIRLLLGSREDVWAQIAFGCAAVKFAIAGVVVIALAFGLGLRIRDRSR